jgi:uncharacterized protein DUF955
VAGGAGPSAPLSYDPVSDLAQRYPDWVVEHTALGWGIREALCQRSHVILLEARGSAAERRSSLAHAIGHLDLEHRAAVGRLDVRQEREADLLAARRLIPLAMLAETLRWTRDEAELAAELGVDRETLQVRLTCLGAEELAGLRDVTSVPGAA